MKLYLAHAKDPKIRRVASSGGFIRTMIMHLLRTGLIDSAIITQTGPKEGGFSPRKIVTSDPEELMDRRTTSVYFPTKAIKANDNQAIVILPCQQKLADLGTYIFELICCHLPKLTWTADLLGTPPVDWFAYRGDGWPGKVTISKNGKLTNKTPKFGPAHDGCKHCIRTHTKISDWVCADPWGLKDIGIGKTLVWAQTPRANTLMSIPELIVEELDSKIWVNRMNKQRKRHQ